MDQKTWPQILLTLVISCLICTASTRSSLVNGSTLAASHSVDKQTTAAATYSLINEFNATNFFEEFAFFTVRLLPST